MGMAHHRKKMNITKIAEYKNRNTVAVLEELLQQAKHGDITGFAFACKLGETLHGIGLTGDYRADPIQGLSITARLQHLLNRAVDGLE